MFTSYSRCVWTSGREYAATRRQFHKCIPYSQHLHLSNLADGAGSGLFPPSVTRGRLVWTVRCAGAEGCCVPSAGGCPVSTLQALRAGVGGSFSHTPPRHTPRGCSFPPGIAGTGFNTSPATTAATVRSRLVLSAPPPPVLLLTDSRRPRPPPPLLPHGFWRRARPPTQRVD